MASTEAVHTLTLSGSNSPVLLLEGQMRQWENLNTGKTTRYSTISLPKNGNKILWLILLMSLSEKLHIFHFIIYNI